MATFGTSFCIDLLIHSELLSFLRNWRITYTPSKTVLTQGMYFVHSQSLWGADIVNSKKIEAKIAISTYNFTQMLPARSTACENLKGEPAPQQPQDSLEAIFVIDSFLGNELKYLTAKWN